MSWLLFVSFLLNIFPCKNQRICWLSGRPREEASVDHLQASVVICSVLKFSPQTPTTRTLYNLRCYSLHKSSALFSQNKRLFFSPFLLLTFISFIVACSKINLFYNKPSCVSAKEPASQDSWHFFSKVRKYSALSCLHFRTNNSVM